MIRSMILVAIGRSKRGEHPTMASSGQPCSCGSHTLATPSVHQTLDEMHFERGIWSAALEGDVERLQTFLDKGIDVNVKDQTGYTALHYASRSGNKNVCTLLLNGGACPNPQTRGGATPLHRAAYCGHADVVKLLLDAGADPRLCDDDGSSPLHKAAGQGQTEVCELLLLHSPSLVTMTDKRSRAPYQLAQQGEPLCELLRPTGDSSERTDIMS